jgi:hypothetical protein
VLCADSPPSGWSGRGTGSTGRRNSRCRRGGWGTGALLHALDQLREGQHVRDHGETEGRDRAEDQEREEPQAQAARRAEGGEGRAPEGQSDKACSGERPAGEALSRVRPREPADAVQKDEREAGELDAEVGKDCFVPGAKREDDEAKEGPEPGRERGEEERAAGARGGVHG